MGVIDSLIGGVINAFTQNQSNKTYLRGVNDTNTANLAIAREANAQNLAQFNAANAFNRQMWEDTNKFNSPAATRARLILAGISPSAMSEGGSANAVISSNAVPAQAARLQAPSQTPNAFDGLSKSVGSMASEYLYNQLLKEQVKQSRYNSEMKLMDKSFYYGEKERRLRLEESQIRQSDLSNYEKEQRLSQLSDELSHARTMRGMVEKQATAEYDNTIRRGSEIEANTRLILQGISESAARMQHMSEQDRVSWFNAHYNANLSSAQAAQASQMARSLAQQIQHDRANFNSHAWLRDHQDQLDEMDFNQRRFATSLTEIYLGRERDKTGITLDHLFRSVLGVGVEDIFSSGMNYNLIKK